MSLPILYTPQEIAHTLKVKRPTVYHWLSSGILHGLRVGSSWRITESDLTLFMERYANSLQSERERAAPTQ